MRNRIIAMIAVVAIVAASSCKKNETTPVDENFENRSTAGADYPACSRPVVVVAADITANTTWSAANVYEIRGVITVRNNATLTIQAGTFIKSSVNTAGVQNGVLVIAKDGKINASGTATAPIVFTSRYLLDCNTATVGKPGDFGGVIILGSARINVGDKLIEGLADNPKFHYGGTNDADSRGTFKFVRIEYAGFKLAENVEVNGLTLGGVGTGTIVENVQVSYGLDDGFEFFGGTVNPKRLISLASDDDQFDFDNGYRGTISNAIGVVDPYSTHSASSGVSDANGIESDNNAPAEDATFARTPKTHPILNNFTIVGTRAATLTPPITAPGLKHAFRNRRGTEVTVNNSLFTGFAHGIVFDADAPASTTKAIFNNISAHDFTAGGAGMAAVVEIASGTASFTGTNLASTAAAAQTWGMADPFYMQPDRTVNFLAAGTKGAVTAASGNWLSGWTKFSW